MLNKGLANYLTLGGEFLQVSGMSYTFEVNTRNELKVKEVSVGKQPISNVQKYKISLPNYIIQGGGNFDAVPENQIVVPLHKMALDTDVFLKYLKKNPNITPKLESRITKIK